jgi:hypothetical protein
MFSIYRLKGGRGEKGDREREGREGRVPVNCFRLPSYVYLLFQVPT